ncbi:unnamed protein product [Paramecium sonneborni]|uniref:Palmitoyltransferase n=1 Tax=Paramecium sonneborni TaxID=65129 RepID=A0A8S1MWK4_9CILI|nr:unnamed protein product [Paramecium sonneborni]
MSFCSCKYNFVVMGNQNLIQRKNFNYENYKLDSYCDICEAYVNENTKHCKHCNRCCKDFDHHCKWVNNCIGKVNYKIFMVMVTSTMLQFFYTLIIYIRIIVLYNTEQQKLLIDNEIQKFHFYDENDLDIKYTLSIVMLIDSFIFSILLLQLFIFHIYLRIKGITTYEFIVKSDMKKINPQNIVEGIPNEVCQANIIFPIDNKNTINELNSSEQQIAQVSKEKQNNQTEIVQNNQVLA